MTGFLHPQAPLLDAGMLDVGDGNLVAWEVCGNPEGKPAVVLHGGPGSGCGRWFTSYFDPSRYRIVLFDQRGCGRSTPHASDHTTDLSVNTTRHLLGDIELLRQHLHIDRWLVFGGSWGSTLALAYAEQFPDHVSELVLSLVTNTTTDEVNWITRGIGRYFPAEWERFRSGVPLAERDGNLAAAYSRLLESEDPAVRERAAQNWCAWEDALVRLDPDQPPNPRFADARFRMAFARLVTHYFANAAFLEDGVLLRETDRLASVPGVLVHGRLDIGSPLATAWHLAQRWEAGKLIVIEGEGHSVAGAGIAKALVSATDHFAQDSPRSAGFGAPKSR